MISATLYGEEAYTPLPLARYLVEEPPSSIEAASTPLPASTPTEPRAMTIAKARRKSPQKSAEKNFRRAKSQSPSQATQTTNGKSLDHLSSPAKPVTNGSSALSSPNSIALPTRSAKRAGDRLSSSPVAKRIKRREHTPTPRAQGDHWSPTPSRAASPVRSAVLFPAADWYNETKTNRSIASPDVSRQRSAKLSPHKPKVELKKYPNSTSVLIGTVDDEDGKKKICYNCGKKGHWFMDCKVGCGKCGGDGHRTIDCLVVQSHKAPEK